MASTGTSAKFHLSCAATAVAFLLSLPTTVWCGTATIRGDCRSVQLGPLTAVVLGSEYTAYFSTYDNTAGPPMVQPVANGLVLYNLELKPRSMAAGSYEADYAVYTAAGAVIDYGTFEVFFSTADSDGNGLPDVFQTNLAGSSLISGSGMGESPGGNSYGLSGQFFRSAGSTVGSAIIATSTGVSYQGPIAVPHLDGTVTYTRGIQNELSIEVEVGTSAETSTVMGSTRYTIVSADEIRLESFTLETENNAMVTAYASTFLRDGNKYVGEFEIEDGETDTDWKDYTRYVLEIVDETDTDEDGIPDLSDSLPAPPAELAVQRLDNVILVSWEVDDPPFKLQTRTGFGPGTQWIDHQVEPTQISNDRVLMMQVDQTNRFFRLGGPTPAFQK